MPTGRTLRLGKVSSDVSGFRARAVFANGVARAISRAAVLTVH